MIKNNKDIPVGAIVRSTKGFEYLVLADDAGQRGLFAKAGTWIRFNGDGLSFGKGGSGEVDTIRAFDTLPPLDAISEGLKHMYNSNRPSCADMKLVYSREDPAVTRAKAEIERLRYSIAACEDIIRNAR